MKYLRFAFAFSLISFSFSSCLKQAFDNPPDVSHLDPNIPCNVTISQLSKIALSMPASGVGSYRTLGDSTIYGIVTADDRSGNFYKQIVIQDTTGGIAVSIAQTNIYNDYPIGRKIYIHLKGLVIVNYKGLPEIAQSGIINGGTTTIAGIPSTLEATYITGASFPNTITPQQVRLTDLISNPNNYLNKLVTIQNMEFDSSNVGITYAPSVYSGTIAASLTVYDCPYSGASMIMYNSAYATFQTGITPGGKGTMTGIFSMYNTPQFLIRDTTDIVLNQPRACR